MFAGLAQRFTHLRQLLITLLVFSVMPAPSSAAGESEQAAPLIFGVVPQQAASKLARVWIPLLNELSETSGVPLEFATAPDIPSFEERLARGVYDIAYMNPYHFTLFHEEPGYEALAHARDHLIQGILVIRRDSAITSLAELANQTVAFPAPRAFAATLINRSHLHKDAPGYTANFVSSHDSVYRSVAAGRFVAGGGIQRTLKAMDPEVREELRILWQSPGYTPHAIATHPRVDDPIRQRLAAALESIEMTERGLNLLQNLRMNGFERATNADWDDVRGLNISAQ